MGFKTVALSSSPSKKDLAEKLGAHIYLDGSQVDQTEELTKMGGAKIIMCTAPNGDTLAKLLPGLTPRGTLLLIAGGFTGYVAHAASEM
jgi:D-arabinose 1-dehydrogenase-like Zn-dependent alcohol dehydrogenase